MNYLSCFSNFKLRFLLLFFLFGCSLLCIKYDVFQNSLVRLCYLASRFVNTLRYLIQALWCCGGDVNLLLPMNRKSLIKGALHLHEFSLQILASFFYYFLNVYFLIFIIFKILSLLPGQHTCPLSSTRGSWRNESKLFAAKFNWKSVGSIGTGSTQK